MRMRGSSESAFIKALEDISALKSRVSIAYSSIIIFVQLIKDIYLILYVVVSSGIFFVTSLHAYVSAFGLYIVTIYSNYQLYMENMLRHMFGFE